MISNPDLSFERDLHIAYERIAGLDEAGRGAWAGPLVSGAVILPDPSSVPDDFLAGVRDSKLCSAELRETLFEAVIGAARAVGVGWVSADEIDLIGLTAANELAMVRAVRSLPICADFVLVDCFKLRSLQLPQRPVQRQRVPDLSRLRVTDALVFPAFCHDLSVRVS